MRILIYGAGALGQALGCMLAADAHQVTLVVRPRFLDAIVAHGLAVSGIFGDYRAGAESLSLTTSITGRDGGALDLILLTTKSYDTEAAVADLATLGNGKAPVVSLQNGCGNVERLLAAFGPERSFGGRVITGFEIVAPGRVAITVSADAVHIGAAVGGTRAARAERIAAVIDHAGLPCVAVDDVHQSLFAKLLYNCALNPLGAVLGVNYGALADNGQSRAIMDRVIDETFAVVSAIGARLPWSSAEEYRGFFYLTLIPATYDHRPSMLQDLEHDKPTEVEALVGYVSEHGRRHHIATPTCDLLGALIRFKEAAAASKRRRVSG